MDWKTLLCSERPRKSTSPGGDHRAEFERDFDRSVFSTPVKRLQDKAQVFPLEPHDAVRTRLTHSLEVSSVARGLATKVGKWLLETKQIQPEMERWIEAIAATCGLIHDLGNPPFGHSGEDAIRDWFSTKVDQDQFMKALDGNTQLSQDFLNFEGNAQSLRIVSKLQILADFNGLNLTFGTLSASCKYIAPSHETVKNGDHAYSKPGFFASEQGLINDMREKTGTGNARNPITFLVEAADDIVYSVADVEDAVKKGVLTWGSLRQLLEEDKDEYVMQALAIMEHILKAGANKLPDNIADDAYASAFRTASIGIQAAEAVKTFQGNYEGIMNGQYNDELVKDSASSSLIKKLKEIGRTKVYCTSSNLKLELMGKHVISDLMDVFWSGAKELSLEGSPDVRCFSGKAAALLSENYRRVFQNSCKNPALPEAYHRYQLVTDYVCGMTDTFAKRLHEELFNG